MSCNVPCDNVTVAVVSLVFISLGHGFSCFALSVSEEVSLLQVITTTTTPKLSQAAHFQDTPSDILASPYTNNNAFLWTYLSFWLMKSRYLW